MRPLFDGPSIKEFVDMFQNYHRSCGGLLAVSAWEGGSISEGWLIITLGKTASREGSPGLIQEPQLHKRHGSSRASRPRGNMWAGVLGVRADTTMDLCPQIGDHMMPVHCIQPCNPETLGAIFATLLSISSDSKSNLN